MKEFGSPEGKRRGRSLPDGMAIRNRNERGSLKFVIYGLILFRLSLKECCTIIFKAKNRSVCFNRPAGQPRCRACLGQSGIPAPVKAVNPGKTSRKVEQPSLEYDCPGQARFAPPNLILTTPGIN